MKKRSALLTLAVVLILLSLALTGCNRERPAPAPASATPIPKVGPGTPTAPVPGAMTRVVLPTQGAPGAAATPVPLTPGSPAQPAPKPTATQAPQAPSAPPAGSAPSSATRTYTVARGDTLNSIAKRFGVSSADIARLNGITNPDLIRSGQTLRIPAPGSAPATGPSQPQRTYIVRAGDTLASIAARFGVTVEALRSVNKLANIDQITVGQELQIP